MGSGDGVIANSDYTAKLIAARHPAAQARIRTIHRGVDADAFEARAVPPEAVAKLKERWGVQPGTKIVLQAARLTGPFRAARQDGAVANVSLIHTRPA
jgi:hypothetical protein